MLGIEVKKAAYFLSLNNNTTSNIEGSASCSVPSVRMSNDAPEIPCIGHTSSKRRLYYPCTSTELSVQLYGAAIYEFTRPTSVTHRANCDYRNRIIIGTVVRGWHLTNLYNTRPSFRQGEHIKEAGKKIRRF